MEEKQTSIDVEAAATGEVSVPVNGAGRPRMTDPFQLSRPGRDVQHHVGAKAFEDPDQPGAALELSLRRMDAIDMADCAGQSERMRQLYISGTDELPAGPFPLVGGQRIKVSVELFGQACMVWAMQAPPGENRQTRRWEPEHLVAFAVTMPAAWRAVLRVCDEINRLGGRDDANFSIPPTE